MPRRNEVAVAVEWISEDDGVSGRLFVTEECND
jgi:hypothetical protein